MNTRRIFAVISAITLYILVFGTLAKNLSVWLPWYVAVILSVFAPFGWAAYLHDGIMSRADSSAEDAESKEEGKA